MVQIGHPKYLDFLAKFGVGGAHPGGIELTKELLLAEKINKNTHILDVGCGTGQTAAYIASHYAAKVIGMDINPIMVKKAQKRMRKNHLSVEIIESSIENCPFDDCTFDLIMSESVLSFVNSTRSLDEIYRLLKNGGRFIAIEPTINHRLDPYENKEINQFYGFDFLLMETEWIDLLERTGFKEIKLHRQINQNDIIPEFHYSSNIEPELFTIMNKHLYIMLKYQGVLDYRVFSCTKIVE